MELPYSLILKLSDSATIEEAIAMQMARSAGMPAPKVLCYGEHPFDFPPIQILMTRLPGWPLNKCRDWFIAEEEQPWSKELGKRLDAMRKWTNPFEFLTMLWVLSKLKKELHQYLLSTASSHGFETLQEYQKTMTRAKKITDISHHNVFTHGDLKAQNILVDENYCLSGFLNWESAGWYPEYWDFTTAMKFGADSWWYQAMSILGGHQHMAELGYEGALKNVTVGSWVW